VLQNLSALSMRTPGPESLIRPVGRSADILLGTRGCLFTFHRGAPSAAWEMLPNRNFYLDLGFLDRLLTYLTGTGWAIVTLDEALQRAAASKPNRYVNFSVDDCYRDTFEEIVPLFRRHGVPVTLFVTTGIPDGTLPMWGAGLEDTLLRRGRVIVDDETREVRTLEAKREAFAQIASAWDGPFVADHYAAFCRANGVDAQELHERHAMSWDMLKALSHDPLVEIGGHTVSHPRISSLSEQGAFDEVRGCRERLVEVLGVPVRHFAFPYGRSGDCGARDFDLARRAGFASAATTRKGVIRRQQDPFCLPRNTINGDQRNLAMMELHLTGATGVAARVLGRV
jgi:peptidoglycan/xylan/chitin deacetylase (PgdA/CDA1 family)